MEFFVSEILSERLSTRSFTQRVRKISSVKISKSTGNEYDPSSIEAFDKCQRSVMEHDMSW